MKRKFLSMMLILCMVVTLLPTTAFAAQEDESVAKVIGASWTLFGQSVDYTYQGKTYSSADAPPAINRAAFRSMSDEDKQEYALKLYNKSSRVAQMGETGNNEVMNWLRSTNQNSIAIRQVSTTITEREFPELAEFYTVEEGENWSKHYTLEELTNSTIPDVLVDEELITAALRIQEMRDEMDDAWSAGSKAYDSIKTVQQQKIRDSWNVGAYMVAKMVIDNFGTPAITNGASYVSDAIGSCLSDIASDMIEDGAGVPGAEELSDYYKKQAQIVDCLATLGYKMRSHIDVTVSKYNSEVRAFDALYQSKWAIYLGKRQQTTAAVEQVNTNINKVCEGQAVETNLDATAPTAPNTQEDEILRAQQRLRDKCAAINDVASRLQSEFEAQSVIFETKCEAVYAAYGMDDIYNASEYTEGAMAEKQVNHDWEWWDSNPLAVDWMTERGPDPGAARDSTLHSYYSWLYEPDWKESYKAFYDSCDTYYNTVKTQNESVIEALSWFAGGEVVTFMNDMDNIVGQYEDVLAKKDALQRSCEAADSELGLPGVFYTFFNEHPVPKLNHIGEVGSYAPRRNLPFYQSRIEQLAAFHSRAVFDAADAEANIEGCQRERQQTENLLGALNDKLTGLYPQYEEYYYNYNAAATQFVGAVGQLYELYSGPYFAALPTYGQTYGYFYYYDGQRRNRLRGEGAVDLGGITQRLVEAKENDRFAEEQALILSDLAALQQEEARLLHLIDVSRTAALESGFLLKNICSAMIDNSEDPDYLANINELCGAGMGRAQVTQFEDIEYAELCTHENYTTPTGHDANICLDLRDNIPAYDITGPTYTASNLADARDLVAGVTDESAQIGLRKHRLESMSEQYEPGSISYAKYISELQVLYSDCSALLENIRGRANQLNDPCAALNTIVVEGIRADIDAIIHRLFQTGLDYAKNDWQVSEEAPLMTPVILAVGDGGVSLGSRVDEGILSAEPTRLELVCSDLDDESSISRMPLLGRVDDLGVALAELDDLTPDHMYQVHIEAEYLGDDGQPIINKSEYITFMGDGGSGFDSPAAQIDRLWFDAGQGQLAGEGFSPMGTIFTMDFDTYAAAPDSLNIHAQLPSTSTTVAVVDSEDNPISTVSYSTAVDGSHTANFSVVLNKMITDYSPPEARTQTDIYIKVSAPEEPSRTYTLTVTVAPGQSSLPAAEFYATAGGDPGDLTMTVTGIPAEQSVWYCWSDKVQEEIRKINPNYNGPNPISAVLYSGTFNPEDYNWLTLYDPTEKHTFSGINNGKQMTLVIGPGEGFNPYQSYQSPVLFGGIEVPTSELTVTLTAESTPGFYSFGIDGRSSYDTPYVRIVNSQPSHPLYGTVLPEGFHQAVYNEDWKYHEALPTGCYLEVVETATVNTENGEQRRITGWGHAGPVANGLSTPASGLTVSAIALTAPSLGKLVLSVSGAAVETNKVYYRVCAQQPTAPLEHSRWTQGEYKLFTSGFLLNNIPDGSYIEVAEVTVTENIPNVVSWGVSASTDDGVTLAELTLTAGALETPEYEKVAASYTPYRYNDRILWRTGETAPVAQPLGTVLRPNQDGWRQLGEDDIQQTPTFDETGEVVVSCTGSLLLRGVPDGRYIELCVLDTQGRVAGWGWSGPSDDGYNAASGLSVSLTGNDRVAGKQQLTINGAAGGEGNSILFALRTYMPQPLELGAVLDTGSWTKYDVTPKPLTGLYNGWYIESAELNADSEIVAWGCSSPVANAIDGASRTQTVAFAPGDGSISYDTVSAGATLKPPLSPVSEYGEFAGWFTAAAGGEKWDFSRPVIEDMMLYAHWQLYSFRVSFNSMGGSSVPDMYAGAGEKLPTPATPIRAKYSFIGWYTAPTGGELWNFDSPLTGNTALYAHWQISDAAVTLVCLPQDSGILTMTPAALALKVGDQVTFSAVTSDGYRFKTLYWKNSVTSDSGQIAVDENGVGTLDLPCDNITVTAEFEAIHSLTITLTGVSDAPVQLLLDGVTQPAEFASGEVGYSASLTVSEGLHNIELLTSASDGGLLLSREVNVAADTTTLTISRPERYSVSGTAIVNGVGVSDISLTLSGNGIVRHTVTVTDGAYSFADLPGGIYRINATDYGLTPASITLSENVTDKTLILNELDDLTVSFEESNGAQRVYLALEQGNETDGFTQLCTFNCNGSGGVIPNTLPTTALETGNSRRVRILALGGDDGSALPFTSEPVDITDPAVTLSYTITEAVTLRVAMTADRPLYPGSTAKLLLVLSEATPNVSNVLKLTLPAGVSIDGMAKDEGAGWESAKGAAYPDYNRYDFNVTPGSDKARVLLTLRADGSFTGGLLSLAKGNEVLGGIETSVGTLTLSRANASYCGQAPDGAVVSLCDADSGQVLRSTTAVNGFFRISTEGISSLRVQAVCLSEGQTLYSNIVNTAAANVEGVSVAGEDLSFNSELDRFCGYLYAQEETFSVSAVFDNSVTYTDTAAVEFAGKSYSANVNGNTVTAAINGSSGSYGSEELKLLLDGEPYALAQLTLLSEPSGMVKTEDNTPVAGAQAVCMVLENNVWQEWDAAAFGQVNPQITADDGSFGWSLQSGKYRILVSCDGYQSYDSLIDYPKGLAPPLNTINVVLKAPTVPIITDSDANIRVIAPTASAPGKTVTVRFVPTVGYMLSNYSVSNSADNSMVPLNPTVDGYSFTMPESQVTITAASTLRKTGLISKVDLTTGGAYVAVSLGNLEGNSLVIAAYDAKGKMLGTYVGLAQNGCYFVSYNGTADKFSAFVLGPVSLAPQLEKITP